MARLDLSFLGTFQVTLDQQPVTHFRSANNQGLLAYLALHDDRPIYREVLATLLWPDESENNARNNLRQAIYQLRQFLGDTGNDGTPYLTVTRQTVQFNPDSDHSLDVDRFLRAIEARDLDAAVAHYHGELLPGFTCDSLEFEGWLRLERENLHRLALEAMFEATQDHLAAGRLDKAQATARRQLGLEPWREPAHRQRMQAYALAGDRAGALAQYEICREQLESELGIEPSAETVALLEEIMAGRYSRIATDESIRPPARTRHNLPADTTPFIGRELELAQIGRLLAHDHQRLVTIVGPGGMGKTRLALAVGASLLGQYEDGVYFVDLAPVERPDDICRAIAAALEYQSPDQALDLEAQLFRSLARRHLLLILDNFEQVLGGAPLVVRMIQVCPPVSILVTSRERLNLTGENRYELGGLGFPDLLTPADAMNYKAVQLFIESGRRARPDFTLTHDNVTDVARICRLVQGMPLGLVLAAAWLELLSPAEIAAEIERSLDFLTADLADLPARQRSMLAVFERSWSMMQAEEKAVLARLSIFRGGFTREAAEQVAGANLRILLALVNKSLLQRRPDDGRFSLHELLRQYAAGQRRKEDPGGQVDLIHCQAFSRLVDTEVRRTLIIYPVYVPDRLATEPDNIRRAWAYAVGHGLAEELTKLAGGIYALGFAEGIRPGALFEQARQSLQQHDAPETDPAMLRLRLMVLRSLWGYDEISRVRNLCLEFIPLAEEHGDLELLYWLFNHLGHILNQERDAAALIWAEKAIRVARQMGDDFYINWAEANELWIRVGQGLQDEAALTRLNAILSYFESNLPTAAIIIDLLWALGTHCSSIHAYEQAVYYGKRCLNVAKSWRNLHGIGGAAYNLTDIHIQMGLPSQAAEHLLDTLDWHQAIGQVWQTLGSLFSMLLGYTSLFGGGETVVPVLSMVYHHPEAIPLYKGMITGARPRLEAEMGIEAYATAWERGKALDFDAAVAQVRAALVSVGRA